MKRISYNRKYILRAIHAACIALFLAACASQANAAPVFSPEYTVSGSNVSGAGTNTTSAYFFDSAAGAGYTVTIAPNANLGNTTDKQNDNEIEFDHGTVTTGTGSSLYGGNSGVVIHTTGTVNNAATATISGYYHAVSLGTGSVLNSGTLSESGDDTSSSNYTAVLINGTGSVTNNQGAEISGYDAGVYINGNGNVQNAGTISAEYTGIVIIGTGNVTNTGSISSSYSGVYIKGNGTVNNSGSITVNDSESGYGIDITGNGTVTNSGTITVTDHEFSTGIEIGTGTVTNTSSGQIFASDDAYATGIYVSGGSGTVINAGTVSAYDSDSSYGIYFNGTGTVTNTGTVSAYDNDDNAYGVYITGNGTVTNSGGIAGYDSDENSYGIYIGGNGTVNNTTTGSIYGGNTDDNAYGVYIGGNGTVTNSGYIGAFDAGEDAYGVYIAGTGLVINSGQIEAFDADDNGTGVYIGGNGTVSNYGYIGGQTYGIHISGNGVVKNTGSVYGGKTAIYIHGGGTVSNSGYIHGRDGDGILISGTGTTPNTVYNSGGIVASTNGIQISNGGTVNLAGGSIDAGKNAVSLNSSSGTTPSTVNIIGIASLIGEMREVNGTGTLNLELVGLTPAKLAQLAALNGDTSGTFTLGPNTYTWSGLALADNAISLEQVVDSGLVAAATAIDNVTSTTGLPTAFNTTFYPAAAANPEAAMNELVGREINQGIDILGVNLNTTLASDLNEHLDNLLAGGQIGGFDLSGMHVGEAGSMYAFNDTSAQLNSIIDRASGSVFGGTTMSTDTKQMVIAAPMELPHWGIWASGDVTLGDESGSNTLSAFHSTLGNPTFGFDYRFTPGLVIGVLASYTTGDADFEDGSRIGLNTEIGALYGTWRDGNWHVNGMAGAGTIQLNDTRTTFGGTTASSTPRGDDILTDWTGGYDFQLGDRFTITPEVGLQYTHLDIDSFTETGAGVFDLSEGSQDIDSLRSHVGFKANKAFSVGPDVTFVPELRALWYHEFLDDSRGVSTSLPGAPALGSFPVSTFSPQRDFALVGVGLNTAFTGYKGMPVGLFINYNVQVGQSDYIANSVNAGIRVDF
ncbi:MAG TPA: autotransporter domain-containing protein [Candidatus Methylacidiphilales bacterium]|nr:autotransporter domain-containing protein [Candidatus Methylacidiphilales bacterium]